MEVGWLTIKWRAAQTADVWQEQQQPKDAAARYGRSFVDSECSQLLEC